MEHIRKVIEMTDTLSWIDSVPANYGSAAAGSLKADERQTLWSIYVPIALICLWGPHSIHPLAQGSQAAQDILDNTMNLVCAVVVALK